MPNVAHPLLQPQLICIRNYRVYLLVQTVSDALTGRVGFWQSLGLVWFWQRITELRTVWWSFLWHFLKKCILKIHDTHLSMCTNACIDQMSIMMLNFWLFLLSTCKISSDFRVGSGRFRFGSFLNDRLKCQRSVHHYILHYIFFWRRKMS